MRKHKKEIQDKIVIDNVLGKAAVGRLGTIGRDTIPVSNPELCVR